MIPGFFKYHAHEIEPYYCNVVRVPSFSLLYSILLNEQYHNEFIQLLLTDIWFVFTLGYYEYHCFAHFEHVFHMNTQFPWVEAQGYIMFFVDNASFPM